MPSELSLPVIPDQYNFNMFRRNSGRTASYRSKGEGRVDISGPINPWQVLGLHSSSVTFLDIKAAFKMKTTQPKRQNRAMASVAYHILTSSTDRYMRIPGTDNFVIRRPDHFLLAACGHTSKLASMIGPITRKHLVEDKDEHKRTLLYIASRSGFYDTCELLLWNGAPINEVQSNGSTPLHGAAYFGHTRIVRLLLQHGARGDIKNQWGNTPLDESATPEIRRLIQVASADSIFSLTAELRGKNLVWSVRLIEYQGEVIAKELIRDRNTLDEVTRAELDDICRNWKTVWHGTLRKCLEPIIKKGLLPAGSIGITPPDNHFKLDVEISGVRNWAAAIFVSPSILYASHETYSERVYSEAQQWCVLVRPFCKPGSYGKHTHTLPKYDLMDREPERLEYRVPCSNLWPEYTRNVVVYSVMFVRLSFLENQHISFDDKTAMLLSSQKEYEEKFCSNINYIYSDNFRQ
ncbi:uncharacterized protein LOC144627992 [Oculina patagonica]